MDHLKETGPPSEDKQSKTIHTFEEAVALIGKYNTNLYTTTISIIMYCPVLTVNVLNSLMKAI